MKFNGIGGETEVTKCGIVPYFGHVYYDPTASVNILAFGAVEEEFDITYKPREKMTVHVDNDVEVDFWRIDNGMYVANLPNMVSNIKRRVGSAYVSTVEQRELLYRKNQVGKAKRARKFLRKAGFPNLRDAVKWIKSGMVLDADITVQGLYRSKEIYRCDQGKIQGKESSQCTREVRDREECHGSVGANTVCRQRLC